MGHPCKVSQTEITDFLYDVKSRVPDWSNGSSNSDVLENKKKQERVIKTLSSLSDRVKH